MSPQLYRGRAIQVSQPIGTFWVAVIPARTLLIATLPDPLRVVVDNASVSDLDEWKQHKGLLGSQRELRPQKLREIGEYVDALDATFPNAIILSANSQVALDPNPKGQEWSVITEGSEHYLIIPENPRPAAVVDGQHRLFGFLQSKLETRKDFELVCAVFFELPLPLQATVFATINTKQTPVRRSLSLNLFGYNVEDEDHNYWDPTKLAVFVTRRLNWESDSPLHARVKIVARDAPEAIPFPGAKRAFSLAAFVDGIQVLISRRPADDTNLLRSERFPVRKSRKHLPEDGAVLRRWYLAGADRSIYELVKGYCVVVSRVLWEHAGRGSMIVRAVGVRALFEFLVAAAERGSVNMTSEPLADRKDFLTQFEGRVQEMLSAASQVDFSDPFFEASGRGQRRIKDVLLLVNKLRTLDECPEDERPDFSRIVPR